MEEKKRKFDFHVEICEAKDTVKVTADAERPSIGGLIAGSVGVASWVAEIVAAVREIPEHEIMQDIADAIVKLASETKEKESE